MWKALGRFLDSTCKKNFKKDFFDLSYVP